MQSPTHDASERSDGQQQPGQGRRLPVVQRRPVEIETVAGPEESGGPEEGPKARQVIEAPLLHDAGAGNAISESGEVRIKAQPTTDGRACSFMTNRMLCRGFSWWFDGTSVVEECPLAATIFALPSVESVLLDGSVLAICLKADVRVRWPSFAAEVGAVIRTYLADGTAVVAEYVIDTIPDEATIRRDIQRVVDEEINPGIAAHSGVITLDSVQGNSVRITMGGGCQGCSAADVTLKSGIHRAFRDAVPRLGAIYDDTDHAAGTNPFFS
jgi:Fe-S cluster biogenesis protein NfuA